MIRIAAAPNAFRGSLSAFAACEAIRAGLERAARLTGTPFEIDLLPMADGGDGTLDVLLHGLGGERITLPCTRADGEAAEAEIGIVADGTTAII
ncbi:MAG TPA: glycerate kinase, partial [Aggregatilineales bacterium]|nr:glycerate kinase [Aggregatilineales bacterium]